MYRGALAHKWRRKQMPRRADATETAAFRITPDKNVRTALTLYPSASGSSLSAAEVIRASIIRRRRALLRLNAVDALVERAAHCDDQDSPDREGSLLRAGWPESCDG